MTSQSELCLKDDELSDFSSLIKHEWLVTNGLGSYACGTVAGLLTRKYHGLLVAALQAPVGRHLLVSKFNESVLCGSQEFQLHCDYWADAKLKPEGHQHLHQFTLEGITPVWTFKLGEAVLQKRIWMAQGEDTTYVAYYLAQSPHPLELKIEPLVNFRSHHGLTKERPEFQLETIQNGFAVKAPGDYVFYLQCLEADFSLNPGWYENYKLPVEEERGYEYLDQHLKVGSFRRNLKPGELVTFVISRHPEANLKGVQAYAAQIDRSIAALDNSWTARTNPPLWAKQLTLAAEQFLVDRKSFKRPNGKTIIAGYPWFSDWSRDTMISLPGLTLDKPEVAKEILLTYKELPNKGILPTFFPDEEGRELAYNNADATLWYFQAVKSYFQQTSDLELIRDLFIKLVEIIDWHTAGTHHNIKADPQDGLLFAHDPGWQLTWMDAKYESKVFTERGGKPVEINALWYNALMCMVHWSELLEIAANREYFSEYAKKVKNSFQKFWNPDLNCLYDVIGIPAGWDDPSIRPNQILAVSLPFSPLTLAQQESVLRICESHLLTPCGLRSLSPKDPQYMGHYLQANAELRDAAYHQGTVWQWLLGHFALGHYKVFKNREKALSFFEAMPGLMRQAGIGTLSEIFDGNAPFAPQGCIAQAWSVAETLRTFKIIFEGNL